MKNLKLLISQLWAELLASYYGGIVSYHSINSKGYWEFVILSSFYDEDPLYKSKGLR